ncbi:MAG: efflux RND transporter periplasmic adaptor subunit [Myxococcales bacterium]|nr:efflux RND transporter periplasmic adaptor subunit [Myxococcota bacterium]MDW8283334.1 efflux RND transporter periplasmic adaptor subunit [Myxococcales bacterium]
MAAAPRLRQDLQVTTFQDSDGVLYYDVSDPRTGGSLRLYDFEWLVAERLDGHRSFQELAEWAGEHLGLETTAEDLQVYAQRLGQLGLCDLLGAELPLPAPPPPPAPSPEPPAPSPPAESVPVEPHPAPPSLPVQSTTVAADDVMGLPLVPAPEEAPTPEPRRSTLLMPTVVAPVEPPGGETASLGLSERPTAPLPQVQTEPEVARVTLPPASAAPVTPAEQQPLSASGPSEPAPGSERERAIPEAATGELTTEERAWVAPPAAEAASHPPAAPAATEEDLDKLAEPSRAGRWLALFVLLIALALVAYLLFGLHRPPALTVQVKRAQPHEIMRPLGASAVVKQAQPYVLRMEAGGVLASVVSEGAEVSAGMSLAVLQSHAKFQKEITELRERLAYYERRRQVASEKGDDAAAREAQTKVAEKQERLAAAEAAMKKAQIVATRSGTVTRVMAHAGDLVSPGSEILEITDRHLSAEVLLPTTEAQDMKVGDEVQLEAPSGPIAARIALLQPQAGEVLVQLELPDQPGIKPGDSLRLVRGRLSGVETLPASAVVEGDSVFVVSQGRATRRKVRVVDRQGGDVLVTGLHSGEEVIVSHAGELQEGQLIRPAY